MRATLREAARQLEAAGVASPVPDAQRLAAFVLKLSHAEILRAVALDSPLFGAAALERFKDLVDERSRRVPLQHLTGTAPFRELELAVGPGVFVPRPETELLVDWGLRREPRQLVDLCSGSGAIALSVAHESPDTRVWAVELEPLAAVWLRRNVETCGLTERVVVCEGDATAADTLVELDGSVDVVLSNPPYVPVGSFVEPEAAEHDPPTALWGGADGLDVVRGVATRAAGLLRPGGWFGFEHGEQSAAAVRRLLAATGWREIITHPDLTGRDRFTTAKRA